MWHFGQVGPKKLVCFHKKNFFLFLKLSNCVGTTWPKCHLSFIWSPEKLASDNWKFSTYNCIYYWWIQALKDSRIQVLYSSSRPALKKPKNLVNKIFNIFRHFLLQMLRLKSCCPAQNKCVCEPASLASRVKYVPVSVSVCDGDFWGVLLLHCFAISAPPGSFPIWAVRDWRFLKTISTVFYILYLFTSVKLFSLLHKLNARWYFYYYYW